MYGNMWCFSARCSTNCCDVWLSLSKHDNIRNINGHEGYSIFHFLFSAVFFSFTFSRFDRQGSFWIRYAVYFSPFFFCFVSCISGVFDVRLLQMNEHWTKAGRLSCFFFLLFSLLLISFTRTYRFKALMSLWTAFFSSTRVCVRWWFFSSFYFLFFAICFICS